MGKPDSPEDRSPEAADEQGRWARDQSYIDQYGNRPDQYNPFGSSTWSQVAVDPVTGMTRDQWLAARDGGTLAQSAPAPEAGPDYDNYPEIPPGMMPGGILGMPSLSPRPSGALADMLQEAAADIDPNADEPNWALRWTNNQELTPEVQAGFDSQVGMITGQADYMTGQQERWAANPSNVSGIGTADPTINAGDWQSHASPNISYVNPTLGADDYNQFAPAESTIGADDWRQFGTSAPNIGAQDWRQFGTTDPTISSGTFDERFGSSTDAYRGEFGDHPMEGSDWDYIQYAPEAIRQQAQNDTYAYQTSRLDPQYEQRAAELAIQLRNQGLAPGDQSYESQMDAFAKSRNSAYEDARNQSLADSRAEAAMLWDQEMQRSSQKNQLTQADIDNIFNARQANIQNYQTGRAEEMQGYLAYQNSAFDQDFQERLRQQNANLDYSNTAWNQDFASRQQQLDANLDYGRESWNQDFQTRQQQLNADLAYGQSAYDQMYRSNDLEWNQGFQQQGADRQAQLDFGNMSYQQQQQARQMLMEQALMDEQANLNRYNSMNPTAASANLSSAFGG